MSTIIDEEPTEAKAIEPDPVEKRIDDLHEKFTSELIKPVTPDDILDKLDVPKLPEINIECVPPVVPQKPSEMSFSANYISESGLDEHQLYALISLFQDKKVNVSIDIKVVNS